jgi:hypothetical protein
VRKVNGEHRAAAGIFAYDDLALLRHDEAAYNRKA